MQVNAGVAYDYFFKKHPQNFFGLLKLSSKAVQQWGSLSGSTLKVSKNISRVASLCQHGYDIPTTFIGFKKFCEKYQRKDFSLTLSADKDPLWIDICRVVNGLVFMIGLSKDLIFDQPRSVLVERVETVTDLILSGYELYIHVNQWQQQLSEGAQVTVFWDTRTTAVWVYKVSSVALVGLNLISLSKGVNEFSPHLTILFTTASLSSHFVIFYAQSVNKKEK
jgi:hypothetical protein